MLQYIKILIITLLLVTFSEKLYADNNSEIDSLINVAENASKAEKSKIYTSICWKLRNFDPALALEYGQKGLSYALEINDTMQILKSYSFIGVCQRNLGDYQKAFEYYDKGLELALKHDVKDQAAYSYINIGNLYLLHDEIELAGKQLVKALEISKVIQDSSIMGYSYLNLGRVCLALGQGEQAAIYLHKCLEIREKTDEEWDKIATVRKYIGDAASMGGNYKEAIKYYISSVSGNYDFKDYDLLAVLYKCISSTYLKLNKPDSALVYGNKCLEVSVKRNINYRVRDAHKVIGDAYLYKGDYKKAFDAYNIVMDYGDTFFNMYKKYGITNIEYKVDQVKKESEIMLLKKDKELQYYYMLFMITVVLLVIITAVVIIVKNRQTRKMNKILVAQKDEISAQNSEITAQRDELEKQTTMLMAQKKEITDSIMYARRIQFSMLPEDTAFINYFSDHFVFYRPKNVVSGDFYWAFNDSKYFVLMVADCTGHGVPGAFMSMLGFSLLSQVVGRDGCRTANEILNCMRDLIKKNLKQDINDTNSAHDGMDAALIVIDKNTNLLEYSGANIPFICFRAEEEIDLKPVRNPVGVYVNEKPFENQTLELKKGDQIYLSSDGYHSQFGGANDRVLKSSGYKKILREVHHEPMAVQVKLIEEKYIEWKGDNSQTDDVMVIGMEV